MTDQKPKNDQHANSVLPDDDALSAFASTAFAPRKPRRQDKEGRPASAPAAPAAPAAEDKPKSAPAPTSPAEAPQPAAAVPAPAVSTDSETSRAETPAADAPVASPREPAAAQVAVRTQPTAPAVSHTPVPVPSPYREITVDQVTVPDLGPTGSRAIQCTIMASQSVRERIAHYQLSKKMEGKPEPTNAIVVRRAFLHAKRNNLFGKILADLQHQQNPVDEEDYDEDGALGQVVGRRPVRGRLKDSGQQSFRPSEQELATYDAFSAAYGFPNRSDFLNALLDEFLPPMPASGRRGR